MRRAKDVEYRPPTALVRHTTWRVPEISSLAQLALFPALHTHTLASEQYTPVLLGMTVRTDAGERRDAHVRQLACNPERSA